MRTRARACSAYGPAPEYSLALRREIEFHSYPAATIEALISINTQLQQPEAAKGILVHARQHHQVQLKESWYEKLQRWADAREAYERKRVEDPGNLAWTLGRMRCQAALGEWEQLGELARQEWGAPALEADPEARAEVARLAASAACNLRLWEEVGRYGGAMRDVSVESVF